MKCAPFIAFLSIITLNGNVLGKPQDMAGAAVLAFGQVKDTFDNGAAVGDKKEFEFMGAKFKNEMDAGFGDAIRTKRSNSASLAENNISRTKRYANVADVNKKIINSKEKSITKRAAEDRSIVLENSDEYDYSMSSLSAESEENERRKRSATLDQLTKDMKNLYLLKK